MNAEPDKRKCKICGWIGDTWQILRAPNPFDSEEYIFGCPNCKGVDELIVLCDEPGCENKSTIGTPTDDGYRRVCHNHDPHHKK